MSKSSTSVLTSHTDEDTKSGYTAELNYHHSAWFWIAELNGKKIKGGSAFTRRGAIRQARRAARSHARHGHKRVSETIALF